MKRTTILAAILSLGLAASAYATPSRAKGPVIAGTLSGHAASTSAQFNCDPQASQLTLFVDSTQNATVAVSRVDAVGTAHQQGSTYSVTANTEKVITLSYPIKAWTVLITNSSGSSATYRIEADDGRPK